MGPGGARALTKRKVWLGRGVVKVDSKTTLFSTETVPSSTT